LSYSIDFTRAPFFSLRALFRSIVISAFVCALLWLQQRMFYHWTTLEDQKRTWRYVLLAFEYNLVSDYVSLFALRYWLVLAKQKPIVSLLIGPMVGGAVILSLYFLRLVLIFAPPNAVEALLLVPRYGFRDYSMYPAFVVHLWLPLFAMAVMGAQLLVWLSKAVGWMESFLKRGRHRPFEAVGYVAAAITLIAATGIQVITR
jgi:hypothetical protein